jgi:hypothetical protein
LIRESREREPGRIVTEFADNTTTGSRALVTAA